MFWDYFVFPFLRTPARLNMRVRYHPSQDKLARVIGELCLLRETEIRKINDEEARTWLAGEEGGGHNNFYSTVAESSSFNGVRWLVKDSEGNVYTEDAAMIVILSNSVQPLAWLVAFLIDYFPKAYPYLLAWGKADKREVKKKRHKKKLRERILNARGSRTTLLRRRKVWVKRIGRATWILTKTATVLSLLYLTMLWNLGNIGLAIFPWEYTGVMTFTGLAQMWDMFSPNPPSMNNWPVVEGNPLPPLPLFLSYTNPSLPPLPSFFCSYPIQ